MAENRWEQLLAAILWHFLGGKVIASIWVYGANWSHTYKHTQTHTYAYAEEI